MKTIRKLETRVISLFSLAAIAFAVSVSPLVCLFFWNQPEQPAELNEYRK